jgi:hypothetical protein
MISAATSRRRSSSALPGWRADRNRARVRTERHQAAHRLGHDAFRQIATSRSHVRKVFERQIHAASREVVGDVAQDVRELKGDAEVDGVIPGPVVPAAEDPMQMRPTAEATRRQYS